MALPKIDTPTFDLNVPSTGEKITFRPWLVKEEKILMLANEGGEYEDMVNACKNVVHNCSYETIDAGNLTMFDLQYLFLRCKEKSVAGKQDFVLSCGNCEAKVPYELDLKDIQLAGDVDNDRTVKGTDDIIIKLKYPTVDDALTLQNAKPVDYIKKSIEYVASGDEVINVKDESEEAIDEFMDSLPVDIFTKMLNFFNDMPMMQHIVEFECKECGHKNKVNISGAEHFFG